MRRSRFSSCHCRKYFSFAPPSTGSLGGIGSSSRNSKIPRSTPSGSRTSCFVREDVHALEVLAVGREERVAAEPVLEHPVVAPSAAPFRGRNRDRNRMPDDDDERRAGEKRLQEAGLEQVRRRLLEQHRPRRDPSAATTPRTASRAFSSETSGDASVRCDSGAKPKRPGPAVFLRRGIDGLEVLALVGRHAGPREAADLADARRAGARAASCRCGAGRRGRRSDGPPRPRHRMPRSPRSVGAHAHAISATAGRRSRSSVSARTTSGGGSTTSRRSR